MPTVAEKDFEHGGFLDLSFQSFLSQSEELKQPAAEPHRRPSLATGMYNSIWEYYNRRSWNS